jgi:transposase
MAWQGPGVVDGVDEFIGIDHHKRYSQVLIRDRAGRVCKRGRIPSTRSAFAEFLGPADGRVRMAVHEAGLGYRPLHRWLSELVDTVVLAHPGRLKIISDTVYKDDALDAARLTELLMVGLVPRAHACSDEAWDRRQLLRQRAGLVRMQTAIKNRVHALIDLHPESAPARPEATDLFGRLGLAWLGTVAVPVADRHRLDQLLTIYDFLHRQLAETNGVIRRLVRDDPRCQWVKSVPGIGDFLAALIVAEIDDVGRFPNVKNLLSYTGLVPGRDRSGERDYPQPIHRQGDKLLRWALVEAAVPATRADAALRALYDRLKQRRGSVAGPNVAKVAVARKLAAIVYRLLREQRSYEPRDA